jgi:preprotein translocase subunit Sec63
MLLNSRLNASKDTLYVLDRRFRKKKNRKTTYSFRYIFFIVFVGYGLLILGFFQNLVKKIISLNYRLNASKDTLYVLDRRFVKKKGSKNNLIISIDFLWF